MEKRGTVVIVEEVERATVVTAKPLMGQCAAMVEEFRVMEPMDMERPMVEMVLAKDTVAMVDDLRVVESARAQMELAAVERVGPVTVKAMA